MVFAITMAGFMACGEKSDEAPAGGIQPEHISMHTWVLDRITFQLPPDIAESVITDANIDPCERDDQFRFPSGNDFALSEGAVTCIGAGKSVFRNLSGGSWTYSESDSLLTIIRGFNKQLYKMQTLTPSAMHFKQRTQDYFGNENTYHFYFSAK
jgi:hypothetical protein